MNSIHVIQANIYTFFAERGYTPSKALKTFVTDEKNRKLMNDFLKGSVSQKNIDEAIRLWDLLKRKIRRTDNENSFKVGKRKNTGRANKKSGKA